MDASEKRRIAEALILSSAEPISAAKIAEIIPYCTEAVAKDLVNELNTEYAEQDRAFEIWEVAGGFQIRTRAEFSGYLQKLQKERALRLSQAALETLAIIAYRQPTTRAEIEEVRGVDAGATVKSLLDRHLIRIAGQREVPGRPMLYGTTRRFLEVFGLERLICRPCVKLDEIARRRNLLERASVQTARRRRRGRRGRERRRAGCGGAGGHAGRRPGVRRGIGVGSESEGPTSRRGAPSPTSPSGNRRGAPVRRVRREIGVGLRVLEPARRELGRRGRGVVGVERPGDGSDLPGVNRRTSTTTIRRPEIDGPDGRRGTRVASALRRRARRRRSRRALPPTAACV
ncbi:MAG: SMC-Scp complex subunit ScpB [Myxococcota bacterium]